MVKKKDIEILDHALTVAHHHGGSIDLKKIFHHIRDAFVKKKGKKLQTPNEYAKENGYDYKHKPSPKKEEYKPPPPKKEEYHQKFYQDDYQQESSPQKMNPSTDDYAILGLPPNASIAEVKKQYKKH